MTRFSTSLDAILGSKILDLRTRIRSLCRGKSLGRSIRLGMASLLPLTIAVHGCYPDSTEPAPRENCRPTFRLIGEQNIELEPNDLWRYELDGIAIGCEEDLDTLAATDMETIRGQLVKRLEQRSLIFLMRANNKEERQSACSDINAALGRQVIADLFFYYVQFDEKRLRAPKFEK